mgnify:CR=1 FL=1
MSVGMTTINNVPQPQHKHGGMGSPNIDAIASRHG